MLPTMGSPLAYLLYCLNHASRPRASGMCFARSSGVLLRPLSRKKLHMQSRSLRKSFLAKRGMARPRLTGKPVIFSGASATSSRLPWKNTNTHFFAVPLRWVLEHDRVPTPASLAASTCCLPCSNSRSALLPAARKKSVMKNSFLAQHSSTPFFRSVA